MTRTQSHVLFSLRVECGVFNQTVHEKSDVVLDLERTDVFVTCFPLDFRQNRLDNLISNVIDMSSTFGRANTINKTDL